jgi:phosphatidylinositol glycan class S
LADAAKTYNLPLSALAPSFHLFTRQLYSLLALPELPEDFSSPPPSSPLLPTSAKIAPISPWQLESVMRMRSTENDEEARETLVGITRLVKKIHEMNIGDRVRSRVLGAVEKAEKVSLIATALTSSFLLEYPSATESWKRLYYLETQSAWLMKPSLTPR